MSPDETSSASPCPDNLDGKLSSPMSGQPTSNPHEKKVEMCQQPSGEPTSSQTLSEKSDDPSFPANEVVASSPSVCPEIAHFCPTFRVLRRTGVQRQQSSTSLDTPRTTSDASARVHGISPQCSLQLQPPLARFLQELAVSRSENTAPLANVHSHNCVTDDREHCAAGKMMIVAAACRLFELLAHCSSMS
eukprot:jgi/Bigna1/72750/fgenesh1_pg.21_\